MGKGESVVPRFQSPEEIGVRTKPLQRLRQFTPLLSLFSIFPFPLPPFHPRDPSGIKKWDNPVNGYRDRKQERKSR